MSEKYFRTGIGQDSHRFLQEEEGKPCILAGELFPDIPGIDANSDGDVVYHAICNAISSITHIPILGGIADELYVKDGITDSEVYLKEAMKTLQQQKIVHIAISIEAKRPQFREKIDSMRQNIAKVMQLKKEQIGITATSGEGLTSFGLGEGVFCLCCITICDV